MRSSQGSEGADILGTVRRACRMVAEEARFVAIDHGRLAAYASALAAEPPAPCTGPTAGRDVEDTGDEATAALVIQLDAVNFGSGWHSVLRKREGMSGSVTVATAYRQWAATDGVPPAAALGTLTPGDLATILGQDAEGEAGELMARFARSLNDLGRFVTDRFGGAFLGLVESAGGGAARLVKLLVEMPLYRDIVSYRGEKVPLLKRAQITVSDLDRAFASRPPSRFDDLDRLTAFADNLVPHVLRLDGLLRFDPDLARRIEAGDLLDYGSPEEVEIRATAVHAVELLATESGRPPREIDEILWHRGTGAAYKAIPRHRCRTTAY